MRECPCNTPPSLTVFTFGLHSVIPNLLQTLHCEVLRWAVRLSMNTNTCYHISGEENVWDDFLGRWSVSTICRLVTIPPYRLPPIWILCDQPMQTFAKCSKNISPLFTMTLKSMTISTATPKTVWGFPTPRLYYK